jgi:secondary thiamine-phosphate synthase enzyme
MVVHKSLTIVTRKFNQMILVTEEVERAVAESGIANGMAVVMSGHTTTGIAVNESLECVESDIEGLLASIVPEDAPYSHARMLRGYGSTAGNATGHLKGHLTGNHCMFPIVNKNLIRGAAQDVYLCEFDGPASRTVYITCLGE